MKPNLLLLVIVLLLGTACGQALTPPATITASLVPSQTASLTPRPSATQRPTWTASATTGLAVDLGVTFARVEETFSDLGFAFLALRIENGLQVVTASGAGGTEIYLRGANERVSFAELGIPNQGMNTDLELIKTFARVFYPTLAAMDLFDYWIETAGDQAWENPYLESVLSEANDFWLRYALDPDSPRIFFSLSVTDPWSPGGKR